MMWRMMQEGLEYAIGLAEQKTKKIGENSLGQSCPSMGCRAEDDDDDDDDDDVYTDGVSSRDTERADAIGIDPHGRQETQRLTPDEASGVKPKQQAVFILLFVYKHSRLFKFLAQNSNFYCHLTIAPTQRISHDMSF
ncbi:hypothetical protein C0J52_23853 [Blattella germanica]|nr:hypothetical protein C0J52_23853 [Blattella germanica]